MFRKVEKRKIKFPDRGEYRQAAGAIAALTPLLNIELADHGTLG